MDFKSTLFSFIIFFLLLLFSGCGKEEISAGQHPFLGDFNEIILDETGKRNPKLSPGFLEEISKLVNFKVFKDSENSLIVDYPLKGSIFPPDFVPPTFLWHDKTAKSDTWFVNIEFQGDVADSITVLVPGDSRPEGEIDPAAISSTNEIYRGTEYQQTARAWKPSAALWKEIKRRSLGKNATLTFTGFDSSSPGKALSRGKVQITISKDPVGAPVFYRDVPLMPDVGKKGEINPIAKKFFPLIAWRLRDVSQPTSKLVLKGLPTCGNCHSFSKDGKTLGMDVDGPNGDKGMYALKDVEKNMVIDSEDVITWNSFPDKPKWHVTIGFLSRVSPDGNYVASTVNEKRFEVNFTDYKFLQVFYPTCGIIGIYSKKDKKFFRLKGADAPEYVHCCPVWSPDGKWIYFCMAKAFWPYRKGMKYPQKANDPEEPQIRYSIYRIPFNEGRGGKPEAVKGASNNGFSNSFPKISPDNKWLVWTRAKNGLLMRPDSKLFIVPANGGEPREMNCNTPLMNSWHSFSPNSRWLVFSSKSRTPYTQAFLTHIDEDGNDSPAILIPNCTAANRAVNIPEFLNAPFSALDTISIPAIQYFEHMLKGEQLIADKDYQGAQEEYMKVLEKEPDMVRALVGLGNVMYSAKCYDEALICMEMASRNDPYNLFINEDRTVLNVITGRLYMAKKMLRRLSDLDPHFSDTSPLKTDIENSVKVLNDNINTSEKSLKENPANPDIYHYLGELYRQSGRLEDSVKMMEKACSMSENNISFLCNLAWMLATNPDESVRDGKRAVELSEKAVGMMGPAATSEILLLLSAAYSETGDFDKASKSINMAISIAERKNPNLILRLRFRQKMIQQGKPVRSPMDR